MALKNVSDKYAGQPFAPIKIAPGASFADMVALKGKSDIGDQINKKILGPLARENNLSDMPDFDDPGKLGSGKDKGTASKAVSASNKTTRPIQPFGPTSSPQRFTIPVSSPNRSSARPTEWLTMSSMVFGLV